MNPTIFQFDGAVVRTFTDNQGEPWFNAKDVCTVLGYRNDTDAIQKHCRTPGVTKRDTPTTSGIQPLTFINEGNLYRLIIKSRKPEAARFEAWVCDDVLPAIRKTGGYAHPTAKATAAMTGEVAIPAAEYVQLLKQSAELATLKAKSEHADRCVAIATTLIEQGRHSREQIAALAGTTPEAVDYFRAIFGAPAPRTVGGNHFHVCKS